MGLEPASGPLGRAPPREPRPHRQQAWRRRAGRGVGAAAAADRCRRDDEFHHSVSPRQAGHRWNRGSDPGRYRSRAGTLTRNLPCATDFRPKRKEPAAAGFCIPTADAQALAAGDAEAGEAQCGEGPARWVRHPGARGYVGDGPARSWRRLHSWRDWHQVGFHAGEGAGTTEPIAAVVVAVGIDEVRRWLLPA